MLLAAVCHLPLCSLHSLELAVDSIEQIGTNYIIQNDSCLALHLQSRFCDDNNSSNAIHTRYLWQRCASRAESSPRKDLSRVESRQSVAGHPPICLQQPSHPWGFFHGVFLLGFTRATWYMLGSSATAPTPGYSSWLGAQMPPSEADAVDLSTEQGSHGLAAPCSTASVGFCNN